MLLYEDEFFRELQFNCDYSPNTILSYKRDLSYYKDFCLQEKSKPIKKFYVFLDKKNLSPRSQARIISCLRSYFKFLQRRGEFSGEIKYLRLPKISVKLPEVINIKDFKLLWKACEEEAPHLSLRNQLVLSFLYGLGCRVSELVSLNVHDFNQTESWISVLGKGKKQRLLPLSPKLYKLLLVYLEQSRPLLGQKEKTCLFFNNKGKRPSRVDVWRWLKKWSLKAGWDHTKSPHSFRHGCATSLLEKGADLRSIQKLLGHVNIQTTQIYTSVSSSKLKTAIENYHPLSQIKKAK